MASWFIFSFMIFTLQQYCSAISPSPAPALVLPDIVPLPSPYGSTMPPDIEPLLPTPGGDAPPPQDSSMPFIPSSLSPPDPDSIIGPSSGTTVTPSGALLSSSAAAVSLFVSSFVEVGGFLVFMAYCMV
ncbi:hypothetical protein Droror1_Dr00015635 [Drosera rotundifolia]